MHRIRLVMRLDEEQGNTAQVIIKENEHGTAVESRELTSEELKPFTALSESLKKKIVSKLG